MCDLDLKIVRRSPLDQSIRQLYRELESRDLVFRPRFWISDEWFSPDGVPGIAVPFYLAHPRLARLEKRQMLEVEGGTHGWCMRILRHETGHAIENAYNLRRRRLRQRVFGKATEPYPEYYTPRPYSKDFVLHLDAWYAQSHPAEDFAETFAVWLNPRSQWRKVYAGWPALQKLESVDQLMRDLSGQPPARRAARAVDPLESLTSTLREHYQEKRKRYGVEYPSFYDRDLLRLFSDAPGDRGRPTAAGFLRKVRKDVCREVAYWTGEYQYTIDRVMEDMIRRCQQLKLRMAGPPQRVTLDFTILLTVQTMNFLHSGRHRVAL